MLIVDILESLLRREGYKCVPISGRGVMDGAHDIGDADAFLPDHDGEFVGVVKLQVEYPKGLVLEDRPVILITEDYVGTHVVIGVFGDRLEDSWVDEGNHLFRLHIRQLLVALHLVFFVETQAEETTQIGGD